MLIDMFQVVVVAHAVLNVLEEMVEDQAQEERSAAEDDVVAVVVEIESREMVDQRRHRKNLMRRWRITGETREMGPSRVLRQLLLPRQLTMSI